MNIRKIAEYANVSVATVSRVLNNKGYVSKETREKVEQAIARFDYVPSALARNFRLSTSHTILVILAELSNMFYNEILKGISEIAQQSGYDVLVCETHGSSEKQMEFLRKLENRFADGAIVLDAPIDIKDIAFFERKYPLVQCAEYNERIPVPYVAVDNFQGGYLATKYLIGKGHTRIAFIGTQDHYRYTRDRREGYAAALEEAGIPFDDVLIGGTTLDFEGGQLTSASFIKMENPPTALFFVSDMQAVGAINYLNSKGYKVPEKVAVMGFDNIEMSRMVLPNLTTVSQPMRAMGNRAMEMLFQLINSENGNREYQNTIFQPEIVERDSV